MTRWFAGEAWDADGEAFLAELRACADARGLVDATPEDTTLHAWAPGVLVLLVDAPGLQHLEAKPTLEVVLNVATEPGLSCGWETYGYVTDSYDPMDLEGVERTPGALARHAFEWFETELRRPLERATWRTWRGERSVVRYADSDEPVWDHLPRRLSNRPPDSTDRLR